MTVDEFIAQVRQSPTFKWFYHFTDASNLVSIKKHGLLSWKELNRRELEVNAPGGNELSHREDARTGVDAYVHLCLKPDHPMEIYCLEDGRIEELVHIRVDPSVIKLEGVVGTLDVSNKGGIDPVPLPEFIGSLDHEVLYTRTEWRDPDINRRLKQAERCELLIPREVATDYLRFHRNG